MLSSEGNENGEKTTIRSNQQKSNLARAAHFFCTFLCRWFARLQRETSRNFLVTRFLEEMSQVFPFTFFFSAAHFHLALVAASMSHFFTAATKFLFLLPTKKCLLCFVFLLSFARLPPIFSFSLSFSCSIFQICGHDN